MKRVVRIAGIVGLGLVAVVACGAGYFWLTFPKYAPADASLHVSADPELRARRVPGGARERVRRLRLRSLLGAGA
jgi:hypothetical protein